MGEHIAQIVDRMGASYGLLDGRKVTWYHCSDCAMVGPRVLHESDSLRPNNKFCNRDCVALVLEADRVAATSRPKGFQEWLDRYWQEQPPQGGSSDGD